MTEFQFLEHVKQECNKNNVAYLFLVEDKISYPGSGDMKVAGYFDDKEGPILACAIGKPTSEWYEVLIHESCHMDQWLEKDVLWTNQKINGIDCDTGVDDWLGGVEFHVDEYTHYIRTMQKLEIDCEKRSVKKILNLSLDVDVKKYIKKANSYLFFYEVMLHTRKWCDIAPYKIPEIVDVMPDFFLEENEYFEITEDLLRLYEEKCYFQK